ncbi:MAG: glycosyltransferase family 4 protein [Terrimicrobiaceae bacterium]
MKIALLTTDSREHFGDYTNPIPYFGTAPQGLFSGFGGADGKSKIEDSSTAAGIESPESSRETIPSTLDPRHSTPRLLEIHVISCAQQPMQSPQKLAHNIWFHSLHVPKWGWLKTGYLGCILAVRMKLREIQPDLVHAQGTERDCAISAICTPYPKLLTIHGNLRLIKKTVGIRPFSAPWLQCFIEGFVIPTFDGVVCITNYTREAVEHETPKTWVVPNAVDPDFLALGEKRGIEDRRSKIEDESRSPISDLPTPTPEFPSPSLAARHSPPTTVPVVLVVANVDARKNQNAFIRAIEPLAANSAFEVRFFGRCGDDEYGREFQSLVAARPWCHYGGMVSRGALRDEFVRASFLALPTNEDNCPMVVLEAQAAGIPVMASNVGGVPDLVEDGVTGLLTDPTRPETMLTALSRLLSDSELTSCLARNGRRQAIEKFHPRVIAERHLEIYREVLSAEKT